MEEAVSLITTKLSWLYVWITKKKSYFSWNNLKEHRKSLLLTSNGFNFKWNIKGLKEIVIKSHLFEMIVSKTGMKFKFKLL